MIIELSPAFPYYTVLDGPPAADVFPEMSKTEAAKYNETQK